MLKKFFQYFIKINTQKFDVVIINNGGYPGSLTAYIAALIIKIFRRKKIYMIVRNYPNFYFKKNKLMQLTRFISNYFIDNIITVSESLKNSMILRFQNLV